MQRAEVQGLFILYQVRASLLIMKIEIITLALVNSICGLQPALSQSTPHEPVRARLYQSFPRVKTEKRPAKASAPIVVPTSAPATLLAAKRLQKSGESTRAIDLLAESIKKYPDSQELYLERSHLCLLDRRFQDAIHDADSALQHGRPSALAYRYRAEANFALRDYEGSLKDSAQILKLGPATAEDYFTRGNCFSSLGDSKNTLESLTQGLKLDPKNADGYYLRAKTYKILHQDSLAAADIAKAIALQNK
jgi:tetratricopeptide (TPR) repeat protein